MKQEQLTPTISSQKEEYLHYTEADTKLKRKLKNRRKREQRKNRKKELEKFKTLKSKILFDSGGSSSGTTSPVQDTQTPVTNNVFNAEQTQFLTLFAQEFATEFSKRFFEHMNHQICQVLQLTLNPSVH